MASVESFASSKWSKEETGDLCFLFVNMDLVVFEQGVGCIMASEKLPSAPEESLGVSSCLSAHADMDANRECCWFCLSLELVGLFPVSFMV